MALYPSCGRYLGGDAEKGLPVFGALQEAGPWHMCSWSPTNRIAVRTGGQPVPIH